MKPFDLQHWSHFIPAGGPPTPTLIHHIAIHSAEVVGPESLFVALPGVHTNGHAYLEEAAQRGARTFLVEKNREIPVLPGLFLRVNNPLESLQEIARAYRSHLNLEMLLIIGSYGKTTTKDLICQLSPQITASPESYNSQLGVPLSLFSLQTTAQFGLIEADGDSPEELMKLSQLIAPHYLIVTDVEKEERARRRWIDTIQKLLHRLPHGGWALLPPDLPLQPPPSITLHVALPEPPPLLSQKRHPHQAAALQRSMQVASLLHISPPSIELHYELQEMQLWEAPHGLTCFNDGYATDATGIATAFRIQRRFAPKKHTLFAFGGFRFPLQEPRATYRRLAQLLREEECSHLFLFDQGVHHQDGLRSLLPAELPLSTYPHLEGLCHAIRQEVKEDPQTSLLMKGSSKQKLEVVSDSFFVGMSENRLEIDAEKIRSNLSLLSSHLPDTTQIMAILKANAYGVGMIQMARLLSALGLSTFGVATLAEAIALRHADIQGSLFLIHATPEQADELLHYDIETGLSNRAQLLAFSRAAIRAGKELPLHLHIDTGMRRYGCRPQEALSLAQAITKDPYLHLKGVMTHLAAPEDPTADAITREQLTTFDEVITQLEAHQISPPWKHAAASAGAIRFPLGKCNMVRIGLALLGLHNHPSTRQLPLQPALSLTSRIADIQNCLQGERVSYGGLYSVQEAVERIGVLPLGFYDGLHRSYTNQGLFLIDGKAAPICGRVCMDSCMVNLTHIPNAQVGKRALFFGEDSEGYSILADEAAARGGTAPVELVTCLGPRVQRIFTLKGKARQQISRY